MTGKSRDKSIAAQARLITALQDGRRYPHTAQSVRLYETHISWVLLAGRYAYKIKKAVDLGFLDFTTLERRGFYCSEEIRLNSRTAPQIYLDVVPIGGTPDHPLIGAQPAIEYAVRMRRFSPAGEMDRLAASGKLLPSHVDSLAGVLAHFHMGLPPCPQKADYGDAEGIWGLVMQNFDQLPAALAEVFGSSAIVALRQAMSAAHAVLAPLMESRRQQGFVRECHGDLHLGNVVIRAGQAIPFDGIEFDPHLRWIDIVCDIAFPFMDLLYHRRSDLAYRLLNAWLEFTGDHAGLALLRYYASYRAAVRAKVNAIRASQSHVTARNGQLAQQAFGRYLVLSRECLIPDRPALVITHGLPGSGKTVFSQMALERLGAIRIRSDVERKRLFGMSALARSGSASGEGIYGHDATTRTYEALRNIAGGLLRQGFRVIVDAAFLKHGERQQFHRLAQELSVPFAIASVQAGDAVMRERIERRMRQQTDASEANVQVLEALQASSKPLEDAEQADTICFINNGTEGFAANDPGWTELARRLE